MKNKLLSLAFSTGLLVSAGARAQSMLYGITNANSIFTISNTGMPSMISGPYAITGVASGQALVGIDSRPSNNTLYALGYDSASNTAQLYTISGSGSAYTATVVGSPLSSINLGATNNVAIDFVPTMDNEMRIIGRNGNNYILNANTGGLMTTGASGLSYSVGDIHIGSSNALAATAYTNSFYGSDATDEVGYDATNNILVTFDTGNYSNSFNNSSNTIHSIGIGTGVVFATGSSIGMDAWYDTASHTNTIYMTGSTLLSGGAHLYSYNMSSGTGVMTDLGSIGGGSLSVRDIAFTALGPSTAPVAGNLMAGITLNLRNLIFFDAQNPGNISMVKPVTGMTTGQNMIAIDYSPMSGLLYGLGYNSTAQTYQLYTIDTATGSATAVNTTPANLALGTDDGSGKHINVGFRFIPTVANNIRITGNNGAVNDQMDATTGNVVTTNTALSYVTGDASYGDNANITSVGYTGYEGDTSTQMFGFDANTGAMVMFDESDGLTGDGTGASGYINTDISLNTTLSLLIHNSTYNNAYLDITYDPSISANIGYMASDYYGDSSDLENYAMLYNMSDMLIGYHRGTSTTPTEVGTIGYGTPVKDATIRKSAMVTTAVASTANPATDDLLLYPNPVISDTYVVLPIIPRTIVHVDVIDLNGNPDRSYDYPSGTTTLDVNMSGLPASLYSVRVSSPELGAYNLKVVKE